MSESHSGARHVDPLDALRAADHRPAHVIWRERSRELIERGVPAVARRASQLLLAAVIVGAISWISTSKHSAAIVNAFTSAANDE